MPPRAQCCFCWRSSVKLCAGFSNLNKWSIFETIRENFHTPKSAQRWFEVYAKSKFARDSLDYEMWSYKNMIYIKSDFLSIFGNLNKSCLIQVRSLTALILSSDIPVWHLSLRLRIFQTTEFVFVLGMFASLLVHEEVNETVLLLVLARNKFVHVCLVVFRNRKWWPFH